MDSSNYISDEASKTTLVNIPDLPILDTAGYLKKKYIEAYHTLSMHCSPTSAL